MVRRFFGLTFLMLFLFVSGFVLLEAQSVSAALTLKMQSGATTVTIEDNDPQDNNATVGLIVFNGPVGSFNVLGATGLSKPVVGDASVARLDLSVVTINSAVGSTLTISLTDTDFGDGSGDTILTSSIGGTTAGTTTFQSYLDLANQPFGTSCTSGSQGPFGGAFDDEATGDCALNGFFSLTAVATVTGTGIQSFGASTLAPFSPPKCSIGDFVWEDADRNGCQDATEVPIEGVIVKLFEDCTNPAEIASTTTNADGFYEFTGLDCDEGYKVQFGDAGAIYERTLPDQDCSSTDPPEPSDANDSDCAQGDGFSGCITFPDPENEPNNPTIDCGYVCKGKIGDFVWFDQDEDGCQDEVDAGIEGVEVTLVADCTDEVFVANTFTNGQGYYEFTGLCPGQYEVQFGNGRPNTLPDQSCDADPGESDKKDSDCDGPDTCVELTPNNFVDDTIDCGKVGPCLELEKQVSGDGGVTFFDADECSDTDVPFTADNAEYKLIVTNCGKEAVILDKIVDTDLGINLTLIPTVTIQPGDSVTFTNGAGQTQGLLQKVGACPNPDGEFPNTATVSGTGAGSGDFVEATDPACVKCGPCIEILKDVRDAENTGGGYQPADSCDDAVPINNGAEYRLTVTNCGPEALRDVKINDSQLGISNFFVGSLAVGETKVFFFDSPAGGIPELLQRDLCKDISPDLKFLNVSDVTGTGVDSNLTVTDDDPACVECQPECALVVDKKCLVTPPPAGPYVCSDAKPIDSMTVVWNGPVPILVTAWNGSVGSGSPTYFGTAADPVQPGEEVTFTRTGNYPNDIYWELFNVDGSVYHATAGDKGQSTFHLSCSDEDMNGPEDCGKDAGDGKAKAGYINQWIFEGMAGNGLVLDCTPAPVAGADACSFEAPPPPDCDTFGKPKSLTFRYTGSDCSASSNSQASDRWECSGVPGPEPVSITIVKDPNKITVSPDTGINNGDLVTVSAIGSDTGSEIQLYVGGQFLKIHTSCSQPLAVGDVFGSLELVKFNDQSAGADVTYTYTVTNTSDTTSVVLTSVLDDRVGDLLPYFPMKPGEPPIVLQPKESRAADVTAIISETTTNTVTVTGKPVGFDTTCTAKDSVTVTVEPPPLPPFVCNDAKPIDSMTVVWNGPVPILVTAWNGSVGSGSPTYFGTAADPVQPGEEVTFTRTGTYPNDIYWQLFNVDGSVYHAAAGDKGQSTFHLSCSDEDMNGPEDCGKAAGDGKAKAGYINQWILEGMAGNGLVLDCTP